MGLRQKNIRNYVIERDGLICCYCDLVLTEETITLDHIVPDSKRGTFNTTNLTVSCAKCNRKRGNQPFFEYCKKYNWSEEKINKYKILYFSNLKIKVLNISKSECEKYGQVIPNNLIKKACKILGIKTQSFLNYESEYVLDIKFDELSDCKRTKSCFELLIRIIEADSK